MRPSECDRVEGQGVARRPTVSRDGRTWSIGAPGDVAWIQRGVAAGLGITAAIPPVFDAYATVVITPDETAAREASDSALLRLLTDRSGAQSWWLGYLDTGAHDVVFRDAPPVSLYYRWNYVLVEAGSEQAGTWRADDPWRGRLPDLMFPADRSWLVSMLWDDDWRCIGGPAPLIADVLADPALQARAVGIGEDATPPGYTAR